MNDELLTTTEAWSLADDCIHCGASAGACALKKKFGGRVCCLGCSHPVRELKETA